MKDRSAAVPVAVIRRRICFSTLVVALMFTTACKTSEDATAAASQMATTAKDLTGYYSQMDTVLDNTIQLNELQSVLLGTSFDQQARAQMKETQQEIQKREDLAKCLQNLSDEFSKLTGARTSSDVQQAAGKLGSAISSLGSLPGAGALPTGLGEAGKEIVTLVQEHKEREAGKALDAIVTALSKMYQQETSTYDSLYSQDLVLAESLAKELVKRGWVSEGELFSPITQPFGLAPPASTPEINKILKAYTEQQIEDRMADQVAAEKKASDCMAKALDEMSARIHKLATDKVMDERTAPVTLSDVEKWIETATTATSTTAASGKD
jgi:hypothetical protein